MAERKVLNKNYPPEFDPSKLPRVRRERNAVFEIRIMAPFNMRCNNCGEYIYKGKKFNSRKEDVPNERYLDLYIYRFYIKCPRCVSEIAFKTDPENADYKLEAGATRNFEAPETAKKEDDDRNAVQVVENRTKTSQKEIEDLNILLSNMGNEESKKTNLLRNEKNASNLMKGEDLKVQKTHDQTDTEEEGR
ncbi:DgyrCDS465 [Dimorphilus gyrociliatus]|uniref:Splicing factor YJU2 n=1 Tax=Dimorphilus gyrociliatus TaxID=2664684 RepID=A0A7I8V4I9_9ANNE|nr:DgyrCDS465 [Dimorphilus gyrociliatus]